MWSLKADKELLQSLPYLSYPNVFNARNSNQNKSERCSFKKEISGEVSLRRNVTAES